MDITWSRNRGMHLRQIPIELSGTKQLEVDRQSKNMANSTPLQSDYGANFSSQRAFTKSLNHIETLVFPITEPSGSNQVTFNRLDQLISNSKIKEWEFISSSHH